MDSTQYLEYQDDCSYSDKDYNPQKVVDNKRCTNSGFGCNCTAQYGADICIKARLDFDDAITR